MFRIHPELLLLAWAAAAGLAVWGWERLADLAGFAVALDSRFLTQLAHTSANFADLFPREGRKQLVKVGSGLLVGVYVKTQGLS